MMNKLVRYIMLFPLLGCLPWACGGGSDEDLNPGQGQNWDKSRTTNMMVFSTLKGTHLFPDKEYSRVISQIKSTEHSVVLLDKCNVTGSASGNPGADIAVQTKRVPVFTPCEWVNPGYNGSTSLIKHSFKEMHHQLITDDCWLLEINTNATGSIAMKFVTLSLSKSEQIENGAKRLGSSLSNDMVAVGTVKRTLLNDFRSKVASTITAGHTLEIIDNKDTNSEYCLFLLSSMKWKLREVSESSLSGSVNYFLLKVESLR